MSAPPPPVRVSWIDASQPRPACDVPWLGTSVVLSNGDVNFCCFSDAVVGNVNRNSFQEVWDGAIMRRIRRDLSQQRFPRECQSNSCPLYRGDRLHYLLERMDGPYGFRATKTHDPHAQQREQLAQSALHVGRGTATGDDRVRANLDIRFSGPWICADLFVAVRQPDATIRFLPGLEPFAVPLLADVTLDGKRRSLNVDLVPEGARGFEAAGPYEICAALFARGSNPNLSSNCYWAATDTIEV